MIQNQYFIEDNYPYDFFFWRKGQWTTKNNRSAWQPPHLRSRLKGMPISNVKSFTSKRGSNCQRVFCRDISGNKLSLWRNLKIWIWKSSKCRFEAPTAIQYAKDCQHDLCWWKQSFFLKRSSSEPFEIEKRWFFVSVLWWGKWRLSRVSGTSCLGNIYHEKNNERQQGRPCKTDERKNPHHEHEE